MKTKNMIKSLVLGLVTVFLMMLSVKGYSQACPGNQLTLSIQNVTNPTSTTVEYDVYIKNTGSTTMKLSAYGGNVRYPAGGWATSATLSVVDQPSATGNFPGIPNVAPNHTAATQQLRWTNTPPAGEPSSITLAPNVDTKFVRFRLTNPTPWPSNTAGNLFFSTGGTGISLNTVTVYCSGNTNSTPISLAAGSLVLAPAVDFVINPVTETCFTSGFAASSAGAPCFPDASGSANIVMNPIPSNLAITYTVDGGSPIADTLDNTFNSFLVSGLTAGTHTVMVTGSGSCTTPVEVIVDILGPTTPLTNTTTLSACDSYTWAVTGQTYTESGSYSGTSTNGNGCTVNETLELTITPASTNTTTISACDSYTWADNGMTYTTSGTYTGSTTNCVTEMLELTITPASTNTTTVSACDSYTWADNGMTYTTSGTYTGSTTNCVTEMLEVTITPNTSNTINQTACNTYTWAANGMTYTTSGVYTSVVGCDTQTLNLTINNCTGGGSELIASLCGTTLSSINQYIYADLVPHAQAYRFKVTDVATNQVQTIDKVLRVFQITQLSNYAFDTTYQIEVAVKINNVWSNFGTPCNVTTSIATTQVRASQCGSTISAMGDIVYADLVPFATGYRFRIINQTNTEAPVILDRLLREFRMNLLPSPQYNSTYSVEVAVRNTDGTYLPYGPICNISTPSIGVSYTNNSEATNSKTEFIVTAYPNPFAENFKLDVKTSVEESINVRVYDMLGKLIEDRAVNANDIETLTIGDRFPSGVYNIIVSQGNEIKTLRIVKR